MFITPKHYTMTDLQAVLSAPWIKLFGISIVSARSYYALLGLCSRIFMYFISKFFTSRRVVLITLVLSCISPWHTHFTRLSYDGMLSLFFLTMGLCSVLYLPRNRIVWSLLPFIAAFHSYHAVKIITLPYLLVAIYARWPDQLARRNLIKLLVMYFIYLLVYTPIFFTYSAVTNRVSELGVNKPSFTQDTIEQRQRSLLPRALTDLSINKYSLIANNILDNFFGFLNPEMLFGSGESMTIYSSWRYGLFYPIEFGFLIFGLIKLLTQNRRHLYFLLALTLISILPSVLNTNVKTYAMRSLNALPFLMTIIAFGLYSTISLFSNKLLRGALIITIFLTYLFQTTNYLIIYHGIYSVSSSRGFPLHDRLLSAYLTKLPADQQVIVQSNEARGFSLRHAFYIKTNPRLVQEQWYNQFFKIANVTIFQDCKDNSPHDASLITHKNLPLCLLASDQHAPFTTDANQVWHISADPICSTHSQTYKIYLTPQSPNQWRSIEAQTTSELCKNWFQVKTPI